MSLLNSSLETINERAKVFLEIDEVCIDGYDMLTACKKIYNKYNLSISINALYKRYLRYLSNQKKSHGNNIFTFSEEQEILGTIIAWSLLNRGLTKQMLFVGIKAIRPDLSNWNPSNWFKRFLDRFHDQIRLRKVKGLKNERICHSLDTDVTLFANWLSRFLLLRKNIKYIMLNCDETMLSITGDQTKKKVIESTQKWKNNSIELKRGETCAYLPIVSPFGIIFSVFILPAKENQIVNVVIKNSYSRTRSSHSCFYMFTNKGYVTGEAFTAILKALREELNKNYGDYEILLFLDRLSCHLVDSNLKYCKQNNITTIYFPASTSHVLQPLDNGPFASFKNKIYQNLSECLVTMRGDEMKLGQLMLTLALEAEKVINEAVLSSAFKKTGLYPFSKSIIIKNIKLNLGREKELIGTNECNIATKITSSILEHRVLKLDTKVVKVKPIHNRLFTGDEILMLRKKQEMEKAKKKDKSSTSLVNRENNKRKRQSSSNSIKKNQLINFDCYSTTHNSRNIDSNTLKQECEYCKSFCFCNHCYNENIEQFLLHQHDCLKIMKNSTKRKRITKQSKNI